MNNQSRVLIINKLYNKTLANSDASVLGNTGSHVCIIHSSQPSSCSSAKNQRRWSSKHRQITPVSQMTATHKLAVLSKNTFLTLPLHLSHDAGGSVIFPHKTGCTRVYVVPVMRHTSNASKDLMYGMLCQCLALFIQTQIKYGSVCK